MRLLLTSPMGDPLDSRTWSSAPSNVARALAAKGVDIVPFDSRVVGKAGKALAAACNVARDWPVKDISRFDTIRALRSRAVAAAAEQAGVDHILCTSSIDAPAPTNIPYSIWIDDTVHLLQQTPMSPGFTGRAAAMIDALDGAAFAAAAHVLPFSQHVADDVVDHYGVARDRVFAVGCGSGPIPPFEGVKTYADGDILFVAKHQFSDKGGDLLLEAWPEILARRPQTRLTLIGSKDAVERARGIPGVTAHDFLPWDDLVAKFHGASFLTQPMLGDPWGQVYLEAMKSRTIVVSLDHRALPELTDNGRNAFLIAKAEPTALAQAVLAAYATPQADLERMAEAGQRVVLDRHGWDSVADRILSRIG